MGDNNLTFDVPSFAIAETTYARFRVSTSGGLGVSGLAADGEVEDYQVTIASPAAASGVFGGQNTISTAADAARSVFAADMDGDGDLDVLSASIFDDKIAWYENDPASADFDNDNDVDGFDFLAWQRGFGTIAPNATKADGDADNDLDVDGDDLSVWESQYVTTPAPLIAAIVAEQATVPSSALLTSEPAVTETVQGQPLATTVSSAAFSTNMNIWLALPSVGDDMRPRAIVDDNSPPNQLSAAQMDSAFDRLPSATSLAVSSVDSLLVERADEFDDDPQAVDEVFEEWDDLARVL